MTTATEVVFQDADRKVTFDGNTTYTIIRLSDGQSRDARALPQSIPTFAQTPAKIRTAMSKAGVTQSHVWFAGVVMPRAIAQAMLAHDTARRDAKAAEYAKSHPGAEERRAWQDLYDKADHIEHKADCCDYGKVCQLRLEADELRDAWASKYPAEANELESRRLRSQADRQRRLATGAMLYDADGMLSTEQQRATADKCTAEASRLDAEADNLAS